MRERKPVTVRNMEPELYELVDLAFRGGYNEECDNCDRYPTSLANSLKLCTRCSLGEYLCNGDTGLLESITEEKGL